MTAVLVVLVVLALLVLSIAGASVRVLREYERGVVFRFGRLVAQKGPGLVLLVPIADRMVRVSLRTITHTIPRRTSSLRERQGPPDGLVAEDLLHEAEVDLDRCERLEVGCEADHEQHVARAEDAPGLAAAPVRCRP